MAICQREADLILQSGKSEMQGESLVKMVLMGESGTGKTSLLELIKNYEKQRGIDFQPSEIYSFIPSRLREFMSTDTTTESECQTDMVNDNFMVSTQL